MKKTDWPIRWDLLLRYRLIEIVALWEGRLTTNHICHNFGIGRQQASKDINTYLRELAPGNLEYDRHLKGYIPSDSFRPVVTRGEPEEYVDMLAVQDSLSSTFETLDIGLPSSTLLQGPTRKVRPAVMRAAVMATRQNRQLNTEYVSLGDGITKQLALEPHSLICSDRCWYLRAWCYNTGRFRNYPLSRFRGTPVVSPHRNRHSLHQDEEWNRIISLTVVPDQRLSPGQRAVIAQDYGMKDQRMELTTRAALAPHVLTRLGIRPGNPDPDPLVQQLELASSTPAMQTFSDLQKRAAVANSAC